MAQANQAQPSIPAPAQPRAVTSPPPAPQAESSTRFQFDCMLPSWVFWTLVVLLLFSVRRAYVQTTRKLAIEKKFFLGLLRVSAFFVLM
jgi:hypothetical protein